MNGKRIRRAEKICWQRIVTNPADAEALHVLALIKRDKDHDQSLALFTRCLEVAPSRIDTLFERANLLRSLGRNREAVRDYAAVVQRNRRHFAAHANLGNALREFGKHEAALACYQRALDEGGPPQSILLNKAIALREMGNAEAALILLDELVSSVPPFAEAHFEVARLLADLERYEAALDRYATGFALDPDNARALNSRGNLYTVLYRYKEAMADFDSALKLSPLFFEALNNRANVLRNLGHFHEALENYEKALAMRPASPQVLINRGNVLRDMERMHDALNSLQKAVEIDPTIPEAWLHAGKIWSDLGRMPRADKLFNRALALKPDLWECWFYKGAGLREMGLHDQAVQCFKHILEANPEEINAASLGNYLFSMNFDDRIAAEDYLSQAKLFGQLMAKRVTARFSHPPRSSAPSRLRVGLMSGDLKRHPVGFFLQSVIKHLQGGRLQLFAYANNAEHDDLSEELKSFCESWHVVSGMSDRMLAKHIFDERIDILIDLSGHTDKSRLPVFAWKPAPVQVTWLGYCSSTGLDEMDYVLGDRIVTPFIDNNVFVERIWQMPESYFCFTPPTETLPVEPLPALQRGYVTFGCFNKLSKISDAVIDVWSQILRTLPSAKLMLKTAVFSDSATRQQTIDRFARCGIDSARLVIEAGSSYEDYLCSYGKIDLALDPFPYPGATTTLEGLWMGVPCVTMKGRRFLARNGETIAVHAGLPSFVATAVDDYVRRAVAIASDINALAALRGGLRAQLRTSPLFHGKRFARHFEQAMFDIWRDSGA
jgi:protein O-GlcNAc transferase